MKAFCFFVCLLFSGTIYISQTFALNQTKIKHVYVLSQIQSRFATTLINSEIVNEADYSQEIFFSAQLPEAAFISNFSMEINEKIIYGNVKEKEQAKQQYKAAVKAGQSAGLVAEKPRETNAFQISVNVEAFGTVKFNLTYQEMLIRAHGVYKHVINVQPEQHVEEMAIDVVINEQGEILSLKVPKFGEKMGEKTNKELLTSENEENVKTTALSTEQLSYAYLNYKPVLTNSTLPAGQLVVLYDVKHSNTGGQIQVMNGYFVHFFAPTGLAKGTKNVVFVLDKSGSMLGRKFDQTKVAMKTILKDLDKNDQFNIIMFESDIEIWKPKSIQATVENVEAAIQYVEQQSANGGTNIYDALKTALELLTRTESNPLASMVIFLTDGEATVGETNTDVIVQNVTQMNTNKNFIIHSLAFGRGADFNLVQRISTFNKGLARKVYEDSDADLQLSGFYAEIASPLLTDVKIQYLNESVLVDSIVQDNSYNLYDGGEMVVVGKLSDHQPIDPVFGVEISGTGQSGPMAFRAESSSIVCPSEYVIVEGDIMVPCCLRPHCPLPPIMPRPMPTQLPSLLPASSVGGFIERMWAYKTIKKLLKQSELEPSNKEELKKKAMALSLQYQFVTELSSMVVVQPGNENATELTDAIQEENGRINNLHRMGGSAHYRSTSYQYGPPGPSGSAHYTNIGHSSPPGGNDLASVVSESDEEEADIYPAHDLLTTDQPNAACLSNITKLAIYWDMEATTGQDCSTIRPFVNALHAHFFHGVCSKSAAPSFFTFVSRKTEHVNIGLHSVMLCPMLPQLLLEMGNATNSCLPGIQNSSDAISNNNAVNFAEFNREAADSQVIVIVLGDDSYAKFDQLKTIIVQMKNLQKSVYIVDYFSEKHPTTNGQWSALCGSEHYFGRSDITNNNVFNNIRFC